MRRCEAGEIVDVERLLARRNRPATARRFTLKASMRFIPARRAQRMLRGHARWWCNSSCVQTRWLISSRVRVGDICFGEQTKSSSVITLVPSVSA